MSDLTIKIGIGDWHEEAMRNEMMIEKDKDITIYPLADVEVADEM